MKITFFVLPALLFSTTILFAQKKIETDRPDQTETPFLTPKKYFQGEFGFAKQNEESGEYQLSEPVALLKYGISKRWEARLEVNYESDYIMLIPNPKKVRGFEPVEIGTKVSFFEEKGLRPKTSLIAHLGLPFIASKNFKTPHLVPSFRFTMQNSLTDNINLGYNLGAEWDGESTIPNWLYTLTTGFDIGERWQAFVEAYGNITRHQLPQHNLDGGIAYFVSDNVKLDMSAGIGLSSSSIKNFISAGFSFRIPLLKAVR
jgi:hypothetical protein